MKWDDYLKNREEGVYLKDFVKPTIGLKDGSQIFTIGSCFARNIEDRLENNFEFPVLGFPAVAEEYTGDRPRGILNKFTSTTMRRELEWAQTDLSRLDETTWDWFGYEAPDNEVIDLGLRAYSRVTKERFFERRRAIYDLYQQIGNCDAAIITFGNVEQWYHKGRPIEQTPSLSYMIREMRREGTFTNDVPGTPEIEDNMAAIFGILKQFNPNMKIIATVSPVPMMRTFQDRHIVIANMEAKLALYNAVKKVVAATDGAYYFPSYEMVISIGPTAFHDDLRHVCDWAVARVAFQFQNFVSRDLSLPA